MRGELAEFTSEEMSGELFNHLPYRDPLVVFPEPIAGVTAMGVPGTTVGFYVYGMRPNFAHGGARVMCSTHHPVRQEIGLMFLTHVIDPDSGEPDVDFTHLAFPVGQERFRIDEAIERSVTGTMRQQGDLPSSDELRRWLRELCRLAMTTVLYLCAEDADVRDSTPADSRKARRRARRTPGTPRKYVEIGYVDGPDLHDFRHNPSTRLRPRTAGTGGRFRQPPHQRRCHLRTFWKGKGRTEPVLRVVLPYWVSRDLLESYRPIRRRIHPVRHRKAVRRRAVGPSAPESA